jgi:hypothetical protein
MNGKGVLMRKTQAFEVARAIKAIQTEKGQESLVRIARYEGALHVELYLPPFGAEATPERVCELLRIDDPDYADLDSLRTVADAIGGGD